MPKTQYQPTKDKQLTDAQEVHFTKDFKQADIAGGYRGPKVRDAKRDNPELKK
ncbi:YfhE family protein [Lentibacillus salicampi]|uniref:YfhE family protein n=1 Tax=Lentibacillus salicampi TaxID=175306 RepID=A0A4Y9ACH2_9BACI|nr:YfhE family protein [Lentibacillus salicampi]TFJ92084.1 YfhE family protein [Lentibacillus salicampi]